MLKPVGSEAPNSGRFSVGADRDSDKKGKGASCPPEGSY